MHPDVRAANNRQRAQVVSDEHVRRLFAESNFDPYDRQEARYPRILQEALRQKGMNASEVLAVSHALSLIVVCRAGVFQADELGILRKRVDAGNVVSFDRVASVETQPDGRFSTRVDLLNRNSQVVWSWKYHTGGDIAPEDAAREAERVAAIVRAAIRS